MKTLKDKIGELIQESYFRGFHKALYDHGATHQHDLDTRTKITNSEKIIDHVKREVFKDIDELTASQPKGEN